MDAGGAKGDGVSEPIQIIPTLTILEDDGEFTVRVGGQANAQRLAQAIIPIISSVGARKLLIITPTDTKVYKFDSPVKVPHAGVTIPVPARRQIIQDQGAPPAPETVSEEYAQVLREEAEAVKVQGELQAQSGADPNLGVEEESPAVPARKRGRPALVSPSQNPCGRCGGSGVLTEGGGCPVCKGTGRIAQWGRRKG